MQEVTSDGRIIICDSSPMQKIMGEINTFAPKDIPVLLSGESGVGKEGLARLIHDRSERKDKPFVGINCAAISPSLIESELFGHIRGAFTGAVKDRKGAFEEADGGTMFLDEITLMPPDLQAKLLRVLQEKRFRRVGEEGETKTNARVISATNIDPQRAIKEGKLRGDLYYRISGTDIRIPPLRDRKEDIAPLVKHFAKQAAIKFKLKTTAEVTESIVQILEKYPWPGNVRELENVVDRLSILAAAAKDNTVTREMLPQNIISSASGVAIDASKRPADDSLGYMISAAREKRNLTQTGLARKVSERVQRTYTAGDVKDWEENRKVPAPDIMNVLACILIVQGDLSHAEKTSMLESFFLAADTAAISDVKAADFSNILTRLREKTGLTQTQLAEMVTRMMPALSLSHKDIYLIENGREPDHQTALAIVNALDTAAPKASDITSLLLTLKKSDEKDPAAALIEDMKASSGEKLSVLRLSSFAGRIMEIFFPDQKSTDILNFVKNEGSRTRACDYSALLFSTGSHVKRKKITPNADYTLSYYLQHALNADADRMNAFHEAVRLYNQLHANRERETPAVKARRGGDEEGQIRR